MKDTLSVLDEARAAFEDFKKKFNKEYESAEEEAKRFLVFQENSEYVKTYNEQHSDIELGINEFADLTNEEFSATYMSGYKPKLEKQWDGVSYLGRHEYSGAELPDSVDWTTKGAVTPVKNQGQCGSCWSFSATGSLEGAWEIATGKLVSISEQQLVDCSKAEGNQGCQGGLMDDAFKYMEQNGMCTEESYSYTAHNGQCHNSGCTIGVPKGSVTGYKDVSHDDENALMEAVSKGPVSIAIEADKSVFQLYKTGVLSSAQCGDQLDHGVLVVGYGELSGQKYWKVKNSWGGSWGMEGYVLLARGEGSAGECGILSQPSYPVVSGKPGPSPPSPSPPSPPPSPPSPSSGHYEKPPCQSDEVDAQIQGIDGDACVPKCDSTGTCPTDKPAGTLAKPMCALQDQSGDKYCALVCLADFMCPKGSKCGKPSGLTGICVYPSSDSDKKVLMTDTMTVGDLLI